MSDTLNKLWDSLSPIPAEAPSEAPEAMEKPVLERLWDKLTKPATEASRGRDTGVRPITRPLEERLLGFIGEKEAPQGYNTVFGGGQEKLTSMTLDDVLRLQKQTKGESSAVGKYQFISKTLSELKGKLGLSGKEKFSPELQDKLALELLERRGLSDFKEGRLGVEEFANNLSQEWASLPVVSGEKKGKSFYEGVGSNRALTGVDEVLKVLGGNNGS